MRCSIEDADSIFEAVNEDGVSDILQQSMRMEAAKSWMSTSYSQTLSNKWESAAEVSDVIIESVGNCHAMPVDVIVQAEVSAAL